MSNHRYGLQFNIANSNLHLLLCILLAGDIATNPGPACLQLNWNSFSKQPVEELSPQCKKFKEYYNRDEVSTTTTTTTTTTNNNKIYFNP
jgi:hypothetical protein